MQTRKQLLDELVGATDELLFCGTACRSMDSRNRENEQAGDANRAMYAAYSDVQQAWARLTAHDEEQGM